MKNKTWNKIKNVMDWKRKLKINGMYWNNKEYVNKTMKNVLEKRKE